jgi:hypothetical protein
MISDSPQSSPSAPGRSGPHAASEPLVAGVKDLAEMPQDARV